MLWVILYKQLELDSWNIFQPLIQFKKIKDPYYHRVVCWVTLNYIATTIFYVVTEYSDNLKIKTNM